MGKRAGSAVLGLVVLVGAGMGAYRIYQRHLSDDVKRLLVAAMDEHATDADVHTYIFQARPLVRTQRDLEVFGKFQDGIAAFQQAQEDQRTDHEEYMRTLESISDPESDTDECFGGFHKLLKIREEYSRMGMSEPAKLRADIDSDFKDGKDCSDRKKAESDEREAREKKEMEVGRRDVNDVRTALGMPPLPKSE